MSTVAVIQARMGSRRFPGKSLSVLHGRPVVAHVIDRARAARSVDRVVIATTVAPEDDLLAKWCAENGVDYYRGPVDDVLTRYAGCAREFNADWIVRLTADCPFLPSHLIDDVVDWCHRDTDLDYSTSCEPATFPEGLSAECVPGRVLHWMDREVSSPFEREHVTLHVRLRPDLFRHAAVVADPDLSAIRLTVDYPSDLCGLSEIADWLERAGRLDELALGDLLQAWEACPRARELMSQHRRDLWRAEADRQRRTA